ncbi:DUF2948 family protein [Candidatus Puniceispirillum sp.]|nr:DUF2948 family protein [Candidatus Puniceispirillum sp.]
MQFESPKLRLLARDGDDVGVLSALLQDAIVPGGDMSFNRKLNEFAIVANRFCWELEPFVDVKSSDGKPIYERRLCGIRIAHVRSVQHYDWPETRKYGLFNLLALRLVDMAEKARDGAVLQLEFSGGSSLRLNIDDVDIVLADLDVGHPTSLQPAH